jgi:hypothetical protein
MSVIIGFDQGSYTVNAGTRQITLSGLSFVPTIESLLYVLNYTQSDTYYALAEGLTNWVTITDNEDDPQTYTLEYSSLAKFPQLEDGDIIHIQFASKTSNSDNPTNVVITDPDNGNEAAVNDSGQLHTVMRGHVCEDNSTVAPLSAGAVFIGLAEDILDYGGIALFVTSDVASADGGIEVQYSKDGSTNWRTAEVYTLVAGAEKWFTPPTFGAYFRVKFTNGGSDQTFFELTTILRKNPFKWSSHNIEDSITDEDDAELVKSVITGKDPNGDFINVGIQLSGALKTSIEDGQTGRRVEVEPLGALKTETPVRLVGTTFSNGTKDPNFWTETVTGTGSVTQSGEITLSTGTTANSTAKYETVRKARKITGTTNQFRAVARNVQSPAANCIRRIGSYSSDDGFFFQFNGTTFQIGSRKSGSDSLISNGSFNGNGGETIDFGAGQEFTRVIIDYTALSAKFFVNGILIHTIIPTTESLTNTLNLPATMEIINENGNTTDNSYEILFATILRLGELVTNPTYKYINTNTTTVCKYNAGKLQRLIINDNIGGIDIYDGTSTAGTLISELDTSQGSEPAYTVEYNVPFNEGLTIVTSGGIEVTVVYE